MLSISNTKNNISTKKKVYLGMSGGVDSSVSAILLKNQGYDVTGVFIKVWQPDETDCGWKDERRDAMRVAALLDIPFKTVDLSESYKKEVADYMINEYRQGRTPNPDVMCNRYVKFGGFWEYAKKEGADYIATGHYARVYKNEKTGVYEMHEGVDSNKDQTYFLWTLTESDLEHVLFPIGHLKKSEVRNVAEKHNLPVFNKKDSQGVCFIGHLDMKEFLKEYIGTEKGDVVNLNGEAIGTHDGVILYTLGERHGFTIYNKTTDARALYVIKKDMVENRLTVGTENEYKNWLEDQKEVRGLQKVNISSDIQDFPRKIEARIRHRQERQKGVLLKNAGEYSVLFDVPQKGMADGQSVVLYSGTRCIGGGIL